MLWTGARRLIRHMPAVGAMLLGAATLASLLPTPTLAASAPSTSIQLPLSSFGGIVVDGLHQHVFVSSPADNAVLATDYRGGVVARFTGLAGARRMALDGSSLFVLDPNAGAIERIDTGSLTDQGSLAAGLVQPNDLAAAGGRLWTTTNGCTQWTTGFVSVDERTGAETSYPAPTTMLGYCAGLAASPADPNLLIAWDAGLEPPNLTTLDVGGGAPRVITDQREQSLASVADLAVSADGQGLFPVSGWPYEIDQYSAASLQPTGLVFPFEPGGGDVLQLRQRVAARPGVQPGWQPPVRGDRRPVRRRRDGAAQHRGLRAG